MKELKARETSIAAITASICAIFFITAMTLAADLVPPLKNWLAATFSHHWIGKSVLSVAVFLVVFWASKSNSSRAMREDTTAALLRTAVWFAIVGALVMFVFFLYEGLWK